MKSLLSLAVFVIIDLVIIAGHCYGATWQFISPATCVKFFNKKPLPLIARGEPSKTVGKLCDYADYGKNIDPGAVPGCTTCFNKGVVEGDGGKCGGSCFALYRRTAKPKGTSSLWEPTDVSGTNPQQINSVTGKKQKLV
jgi:hypothetical protein